MVDKNGVLVSDAEDVITVNVTGVGSLIGMDNGDMYYAGLFKTNIRKMNKGKLLVSIRSTGNAGNINIELKSENIIPLILKIQTIKTQ